jgi:hypothetical protein
MSDALVHRWALRHYRCLIRRCIHGMASLSSALARTPTIPTIPSIFPSADRRIGPHFVDYLRALTLRFSASSPWHTMPIHRPPRECSQTSCPSFPNSRTTAFSYPLHTRRQPLPLPRCPVPRAPSRSLISPGKHMPADPAPSARPDLGAGALLTLYSTIPTSSRRHASCGPYPSRGAHVTFGLPPSIKALVSNKSSLALRSAAERCRASKSYVRLSYRIGGLAGLMGGYDTAPCYVRCGRTAGLHRPSSSYPGCILHSIVC